MKNKITLVILIIAIGTLIRFYNINGTMFDFNPCRQAVTAAIARNFATDPDSKFLLPRADNEGPNPGYFMFELPILPYAMSFLIRIFGAHNWVFRLPSIVLFALSAFYFFKLCGKVVDFRTALLSLVFYLIAPINILMSRVAQTESFMLLALFYSVYYFIVWLEEGRKWALLFCTLGFCILVLLKIPNLYIFLFIGSLFFIYKKTKLIPYFILPIFFVLAVNFWWWFIYSAKVRALFPTAYTLVAGNVQVFSLKHIIDIMGEYTFSKQYWLMTARHCFWIIFSPLLFFLFLMGILPKKERKTQWFLLSWLGSVIVFLSVVPTAATQDYYKIHLVPAGSIFAAICYFWIVDRIKPALFKKAAVTVFWAAVISSIFVIIYPVIKYKPIFENQAMLGEKVQEVSEKNDLVIAAFGPDPMLLFYCNRKGWEQYLCSGKDNIGLLEQRRFQGARYFVCGNLDEFECDPVFKQYMVEHYKIVYEKEKEYESPKKYSIDYFIWALLGRFDKPFAEKARAKLERSCLGGIIFDLRNRM